MKIDYDGSIVQNGVFMTPQKTASEPHIVYDIAPNKLYTLILHDPDSIRGEYIHWLKVNVNIVNSGNTILDYAGPTPPPGTGTHRYIFLLLEQDTPIISKDEIERTLSLNQIFSILGIETPREKATTFFTSKYTSGSKGGKKRINKTRKIRHHSKKNKRRKSNKNSRRR